MDEDDDQPSRARKLHHVWLSDSQAIHLDYFSAASGMTKAEVIRQALASYMKRKDPSAILRAKLQRKRGGGTLVVTSGECSTH